MMTNEAAPVQGIIKSYHLSPKGDVDGLSLEDGREVRFPPHLGHEVSALVGPGDEVACACHEHVNPKGHAHVHADSVTQVSTGRSLALDGPPSSKDPVAHHGPPSGRAPHAHDKPTPHHEQMLAEIRAIRAALGGQDEPRHPGHHGPPHEPVLHALRSLRALVERRAQPPGR